MFHKKRTILRLPTVNNLSRVSINPEILLQPGQNMVILLKHAKALEQTKRKIQKTLTDNN